MGISHTSNFYDLNLYTFVALFKTFNCLLYRALPALNVVFTTLLAVDISLDLISSCLRRFRSFNVSFALFSKLFNLMSR